MSEDAFYGFWNLGYVLGAAVVVAVAVLLIVILLVARKIESLATVALNVAGDIESRTRSIWLLGEANRIVSRILAATTRIETSTLATADALERSSGRSA